MAEESKSSMPDSLGEPAEFEASSLVSAESPDPDRDLSGEVIGDPPEDSPEYTPLPYPVVAIGVSTGLEASYELLDSLPTDTGMSFVLIPYALKENDDQLPDILARHTNMTLVEIQPGLQPQPNSIYVLPRDKWARLERGRFVLESQAGEAGALPINHFFSSLASDQKNRAIGVILSGVDGDGATGLAEIKAEGGISIVQAPESAQFPQMPRASLAAYPVDLVLNPAQIGGELGRISRQLSRAEFRRREISADLTEAGEFQKILALLRSVSGIHFRQYKPSTLQRRVIRRMLLERIDTLGEYVRFLQSNPRELRELQEDVLINVTRFFRDPEVFEVFKSEILPKLLESREHDQQIRIWVAGCSTGQEAYSIAMCLIEFLSSRSLELPVQVFGTDASEQSIGKARLGIYPDTIVSEISPERLRRFFVKVANGYQISKRVRDFCIFARQNLCIDPPFSRIDLVSCRNVLIYFGAELQNQVMPTFHYALRPGGYLLLGASESIRGYSHLFQQLDRKHKFFFRLEAPSRLLLEAVTRAPSRPPEPAAAIAPESWTDLDLQRAADRIVIARYGPPGVIVNSDCEILQSRGHTRPFLEMSQGTANLNLLRMVPESILIPLRDAVSRAIQFGVPARVERVSVREAERPTEITIEVLPIPSFTSRSPCFLVLFVPIYPGMPDRSAPAVDVSAVVASSDGRDAQILKLRQDLEANRVYLQTLLDDRDAKNQELVSANEEVQSANEELQSTNEELETTKEELQSANEELQTVNEELRERNSVLTQTSNDLSNLLNSVNLPVLMLSNDLLIRHFTPPTQRLISLRSADIGRPLADIRLNFTVPNLEAIFNEVLDTLTPREMEIQDHDGRAHLLRVRPYRTTDNKIDGLVVVLVDVDQFRRTQQEVKDARDFARSVIENLPVPLAVLNTDLRVSTVNDAFRKLSGAPAEVFEGRTFSDLAASYWRTQGLKAHLERLREQDSKSGHFQFQHQDPGESRRTLRFTGCILQPDHEKALLITVEDITNTVEAEHVLMVEREELTSQVHSAHQQLGRTQEELRALAGRLMQSQEDERRRVARDLHDDVSQKLALLANEGKLLAENKLDESSAKQGLGDLNRRLEELSETVRGISHGLHPSTIEDLGLSSALKNLVDEFGKRENMPVTYSRRHVPATLPLDIATNLYRVAQEALRNVSKYAGKTHLKVTLTGNDGRLQMEIADFGEGFEPKAGRGGLGLLSMEERTRLIGGTFTLETSPGKGTRITIRVPLPKNVDPGA